MTIHPYFKSGDIVRMETTSGPFVARMLDLKDPSWVEFRWDWGICPLDPEYDEDYIDG